MIGFRSRELVYVNYYNILNKLGLFFHSNARAVIETPFFEGNNLYLHCHTGINVFAGMKKVIKVERKRI
jgi:hypothetical protein